MREIVKFPDKVLRKVAKEVRGIDEELLREVEELKKILKDSENGAGLAAPQIGISKSFLALKGRGGVRVLFNPKMIETYGEKTYPKIRNDDGSEEDFLEGCLSFPDLFGTVKRFLKIRISYDEIEGNELKKKEAVLEGFEAIVWQHEADHLSGILFVDHVKEEKGKFYEWKGEEKKVIDIDKILREEK